ncbi:MAG: TonB family protein [Spirochaetes bacterium]|nr:TonB family protein [Spirochaetota bacterium]
MHLIIILYLFNRNIYKDFKNSELNKDIIVNIVFTEESESNLKLVGKQEEIIGKVIYEKKENKNNTKSSENKIEKKEENAKTYIQSNLENEKKIDINKEQPEGKEEKKEQVVEEDKSILSELTTVKTSSGGGTESSEIIWDNNVSRKIQIKIIPQVPDSLKKLSGKFIVIVYIEVNKFGSVIFVQIYQSSGIPELDNICKEVVRKWVFNMISEDRIDSGKVTFIFNFN